MDKFNISGRKNRVGEIHITNENEEARIVEYFNSHNCTIEFKSGFKLYNIEYHNLKKGKVKNPYHPSVYGIGYLGVGKYVSKIDNVETLASTKWRSMLHRVVGNNKENKHPSYKGVKICKEWECFQNFAEWWENNFKPHMNSSWQLDKDILIKGNKVYSPDTCLIVPESINYLILSGRSKRGDCPIGVCFDKKSKKYQVSLNTFNSGNDLGKYNTKIGAFYIYKVYKEKHIKRVADEWRPLIGEKAYECMYNWKIEITD